MDMNQQTNPLQPSRKQHREARRLERRKEDTQRDKKQIRDRIILWGSVLVGLGLIVWGLVALSGLKPKVDPEKIPDTMTIIEHDRVKGKNDATVTLVEYSDFQCPACGVFYPMVKKAFNDYDNRIRFVYRNFPLKEIHQHAELAARAAEAAGLQGKFWEMHDKIFEGQADWSKLNAEQVRETFEAYAHALELDVTRLKNDIDSGEVRVKVDTDYQSGVKAGVNSTPTFYLNGQQISPQSYDDFKRAIDQALGV